jgi:hypothetical protein
MTEMSLKTLFRSAKGCLRRSVSKFVFIQPSSHGLYAQNEEDKNGHGRKRSEEKYKRWFMLAVPAKKEKTQH